MAEGVNAVENLLTDVAAFSVADGAGFNAALERDIGFVHVLFETGDTGFDAGEFESVPSGEAATDRCGSGDKFFGELAQSGNRDEQIEARQAEAWMIHKINIPGRISDLTESEGFRGDVRDSTQRANHYVGLWTLEGEETIKGRDIDDLDIVRNDILFEALGDGSGEAGLEIDEQFVGEAEDVEVALHLAFGGDEGGVAALAWAERVDVIGDLAVKEADTIGAGQAETGTEAEIEDGATVAQCMVLICRVAVIGDDFVGVDGGEAGPQLLMEIVKG